MHFEYANPGKGGDRTEQNTRIPPMPLHFLAEEPLSDGVRRMAREQLNHALQQMTRLDKPDKNIHETRKSFKKLRGLLRLVRPGLGELCYQRENAFYRDTGKRLAPLRESYVRTRTLGAMAKRYREAFLDLDLKPLKAALRQRHRAALDAFVRNTPRLQDLRDHLVAGITAVDRWPRVDDEWVPMAGMARIYRQGRKEQDFCRQNPETEALHDWRKRVKYLWYHTQILSPCWPAVLKGQAEALERLGDLLGDDHDLADFQVELTQSRDLPLPAMRRRGLLRRLVLDRKQIQAEAFELGARIYHESPAAFIDRMSAYWRTWRADTR